MITADTPIIQVFQTITVAQFLGLSIILLSLYCAIKIFIFFTIRIIKMYKLNKTIEDLL
jgi:hypothetical protein